MSELLAPVRLPSTEYKVTFGDGSVSVLSVHPDETLEGALAEMLQAMCGGGGADIAEAASASDIDVRSVELLGALGSAAGAGG